jgi:hypothetical protein
MSTAHPRHSTLAVLENTQMLENVDIGEVALQHCREGRLRTLLGGGDQEQAAG